MSTKEEISLVVGTAGHIDHGKTHLVRALTGVNCDRLGEERKRGITIELGFAPLTLPSNRIISLVDVPGHDKFIRQMVSGASGVDAIVLVVAADEGVMPQTREHLDILCLLGVEHGIIAITKTDTVDGEMVELVREDIASLVEGTFLEGAPMYPVSAVKGTGLDELKTALDGLVDEVKPRERNGAYFMPVDRSFPVSGFGTVVTGTAYKGLVAPGDEIEVQPSGGASRVRSVQVHGHDVKEATAGQRVAMCVSDLGLEDIKRGDVVCAAGVYRPTSCIDVMLKLLPVAPEPLTHWQRVRLHIGTSDVLARVSILDAGTKSIAPGTSAAVQLVLEEPIVASLGQRFVIRFYSPLRTIGGGEVLLPYASRPSGKKRRDQEHERLLHLSTSERREDRISAIVDIVGRIPVRDLMVEVQERRNDLMPILETLEKENRLYCINVGDGMVFSAERYNNAVERLRSAMKKYHTEYPHHKGCAPELLVNTVFAEEERKVARVILATALERRRFKKVDDVLALPKFEPVDDSAYRENREKVLSYCRTRGFTMPYIEDLPGAVGLSVKDSNSLLDQMKKAGDVIVLDGTFVLSKELMQGLIEKLRGIEGGFTLAQARDAADSSRKYVLPVMEYMDGHNITRRVGDKRILLSKN